MDDCLNAWHVLIILKPIGIVCVERQEVMKLWCEVVLFKSEVILK